MPPPHPLLASKIQGYVCRSCLSKLRVPRNPRPLWQARSVASDNGPSESKEPRSKKSLHDQHQTEKMATVRMFDESLDGVRTEVKLAPEDHKDEVLFESLQSRIEDLEGKMGEEKELDEEEIQDHAIENQIGEMFGGEEFEEYILSQMEKLNEEVDRRMEHVDIENVPKEEYQKQCSKVREELLERYKTTGFSRQRSEQGTAEGFPSSTTHQGFLIDISQFPGDIQLQLHSLNNYLMEAAERVDEGYSSKMAGDAWKLYNSCRSALLSQPNQVPTETWQLLWGIFAEPNNVAYRFMKALGDDMTQAGLPLQSSQRLLHIRAQFATGGQEAAIEQWEGMETGLEDSLDFLTAYWKLGVSMCSEAHHLDKALRAATSLVRISKDPTDCRVLIPLIQAFLSSNEEKKEQKAWALYVRLRLGLGSEIEMRDYDAVVSMLFKAYEPNLALGVFRDMMLTGHESAKLHDSIVRYKDGPGVKKNSELMRLGEKGFTWDNPQVLSQLPAEFNNKFFFGKWLKKLISEGQFAASINVFNLMHERGIRADPRHLNGLIGAWMRSPLTRSSNHQLAEDTAWRMIRERIEFVKNRDAAARLTFPLRALIWDDKPDHKGIWKHPNATIETFAILVEDYRRRQRHDRMKDLFGALKQARVPPNTYFMNQMIMVDSEVQQYWSWDMYSSFTRVHGVPPDFDTFSFLWYLAKKAVDPTHRSHHKKPVLADYIDNSDVPRTMFAEMIKWAPKLNEKKQMPHELYDMIILSFSLSQDHVGTAVVLRALQRYFNMFPNENTIRTIVLQLARASIGTVKSRKTRRLDLAKTAVKQKVAQVATLLESLKKQRVDILSKQGIVFEELDRDAKLEESLLLMTELLRQVSEATLEDGQSVAQLSDIAARDMGAVDCAPWADSSW